MLVLGIGVKRGTHGGKVLNVQVQAIANAPRRCWQTKPLEYFLSVFSQIICTGQLEPRSRYGFGFPRHCANLSQRSDLSVAIQLKHFVALQFLFQPASSLAQWSLARP